MSPFDAHHVEPTIGSRRATPTSLRDAANQGSARQPDGRGALMADLTRAVLFGGDTPWLLLAAPVALLGAGIAWFLTPRDRR